MFKIGIRRLLSRISSIEDKPFHTFHTYQGYIETKREYSENLDGRVSVASPESRGSSVEMKYLCWYSSSWSRESGAATRVVHN